MDYKVVITPPAQHRLDMYVGYTILTLKNKQAAKAIIEDAQQTKGILASTAGSHKLCN